RSSSFFLFHDPAPPAIYTLSLHDALPISGERVRGADGVLQLAHVAGPVIHEERRLDVGRERRRAAAMLLALVAEEVRGEQRDVADRKSTRLNSSHLGISYAVFCLKKKKKN